MNETSGRPFGYRNVWDDAEAASMENVTLVGYLAALCSMTSFTPQAWKIIKTRDTSSISAPMYAVTNDRPVIDAIAPLSISEQDGQTGSSAAIGATGTVHFSDVDLTDTHGVGGYLSAWNTSPGVTVPAGFAALIAAAFEAHRNMDTTGTGDGQIGWTFALTDKDVDFLAAGETVTLEYTITATDDSGTANASGTQTVHITITGTNDRPVIDAIAPLSISEQDGQTGSSAAIGATGTVDFSDVDLTDTHGVGGYLSAWNTSAGVTVPAGFAALIAAAFEAHRNGDSTGTGNGQIGWTFALTDKDVDFLAAGETVTLEYTITATDDSGTANASGTQTVHITITGTNDAPVIDSYSGLDLVSLSIAENATAVTTVHATDVDSPTITYSISGGADAGLFTIDDETGALSFKNAPDFENPQDNGHNNHYEVIVTASDGTLFDTQAFDIAVTDVVETLPPVSIANDSPYYAFSNKSYADSVVQPYVINFDADTIFNGGSNTFTYTFTNVFGPTGWLTVNAANGTVTGNPTNQSALTVYRIDAVDTVTHEQSFTCVAFSALNDSARYVVIDGTPSYAGASSFGDVVFMSPTSTVTAAQNVSGDSSSDVLIGNGNSNTLHGDSQSDALYGGAGDDYLFGESDSDYLNGGAGNDELYGGSQSDVLVGGEGNDKLYGESDNDILLGGAGDDILDGGFGADRLYGEDGNDTLIVMDNGDLLYDGGNDVDTLRVDIGFFNNVADSVIVNIEKINLTASGTLNLSNQTEDLIITDSSLGGNNITGGSGNDIIIGGKGADVLRGGVGSDTFRYLVGDDNAIDTLADFETGANGDTIDLSDLLSGLAVGDRESHVRFHYSNGADHYLNNDGAAPVNVNGTSVALQVDLGSGWKTIASINDTGGNLTGSHDAINMMLTAGTTAQYHI
jgi:VCBS repeat-containing protein